MAIAKGQLSSVVSFTSFELRQHVKEALETAWTLADGNPVNARHLLTGALIVGRSAYSEAFSKLAEFLPIGHLPERQRAHDADLGAVSLSAPLAIAYSVAEPFFREVESVWGRDYITFALLAVDDPSLQDLAKEAGTSLEDLQDRWFEFVTADSSHRTNESWEKWWQSAGVPLPEQRRVPPDTASQMAAQVQTAPTAETGLATYLLTWNPRLFPFSRFENAAREVAEKGEAVLGWSTGQRKSVSVGDRVFLMRQREEPRGLVGSGRIEGSVRELPHWNPDEAMEGKTYNQAVIRWDVLQEMPVVSLDQLVQQIGQEGLWSARIGGMAIPSEVAERLGDIWEEARPEPLQPTPSPVRPSEVTAPLAWVETDAIPVIGDLKAYQPSKYDSLDAKTQAEIFATLLIAREVRPPLALGLLGDWGVGKTFFMRLMQEHITSVAGKEARVEGNSDSVSRAAQIEFNAWHYVDSDLWASLASHIFDGLSEELLDRESSVEEVRRRLRRTIHSSQREQEEAVAAIGDAQTERKQAARKLAVREAVRAKTAAAYETHYLKRIWNAVLAVKPDPDDPSTENWPDLADAKRKAEETARRLGVTDAIDSAEEAQRVYRSLRDLTRRGSGMAAALASTFTGGRLWISVPLLALLVAVVLAWPWILTQLSDLVGSSELLASVLQVGTVVAAGATWMGKNVKSISSALGYLEAIQEEMREPRVKPAKPTSEERRLKGRLEKLDAKIATEQRRIEEADRRIAEAQAEIQRINAGGLVYDFLEGRVRDSRYLDRLGLISVIRQDFEELGTLLRDWVEHGAGNGGGDNQTPANVTWDARPIERIILYIDDLDRCPPKRVVEVLQAVHLLLAFDLFVVVVAVDARWLERSLNEDYNPWTVQRDGGPPEEPLHRFSAHNYLEKIFQIPFSLPVMDEQGYRSLVKKLTTIPAMYGERAEPEGQGTDAEPAPGVQGAATDEQQPAEQPVAPGAATEDVTAAVKDQEGDQREVGDEKPPQETAEEAKRARDAEEAKRVQEETRKRLEAMQLNAWEEQFIAALHRFVDTPRLAKRLVNIYRLLRVRAAEEKFSGSIDRQFSQFIDRDDGEYRAVLILLALNIGYADVVPELFDGLGTVEGGSFRSWLQQIYAQFKADEETLRSERLAQRTASGSTPAPSSLERRLLELRDGTLRIREDIDDVIKALEDRKAPPFDDRLEAYKAWSREVGRYSFGWHLKSNREAWG